ARGRAIAELVRLRRDGEVHALLRRRLQDVGAEIAVERDQLRARRVAGAAGQPLELVEQRRQIGLADGKSRRAAERLERAHRIARLLLELRDAPQPRDALARIRRVARPQLRERDQLVELARLLIVRLQHLGRAQTQVLVVEQTLQPRARLRVPRIQLEHLAIALERLVVALEPVEDPGDAQPQLDALLRRRVRLLVDRQLPLQNLQQVDRAVLRFVEPRQRLERRLIVRLLVEDRVIAGDRLARVFQLALSELRDAPHEIAARVRHLLEIEPSAQHVHQLRPLALRGVQPFERVERALLLGVGLENFAVRADGRARIDRQLLLDAPDAEEQLLAILGTRRPLGLAVQDVDQLGPRLGRLVEARERRRRRTRGLLVRRIEIEQPPPRRAPLLDVAQIVLVQLGDFFQQLAAQLDVFRLGRDQRLLPRRRQVAEPPEHHRQPLDVLAHLRVRRIDAQRLAPRGERQLPRAQLLLLQLGEALQQRRRLAPGRRLALRAEHQRQLGPRLVGDVERLERARDALPQLRPLH